MDLQQPQANGNNSSRSETNTAVALIPATISNPTTSSISTAARVQNISTVSASPSVSPATTVVNHQHNHHHHQPQQQQHRNSQNLVTQKTNQVSTVLLYNIPIVSLYIEGQERLCLAQISNTLLKQFSYNEIHNRRVALGITCVQCTPVQLEILRRAGAMPVSSRRCGMITRREAERLCKSFLGDNTPPRLPDDFAFNVQHKCSWGCRGSFLPSRYNSSRAKCIKCHYCGMFFSPNKFIFHSHRIGPGDKYVQPDAANFNSWRRHMMLSGQPPQEVCYAWEDVKAMFNGGTRKRLMISSNSSSSPSPRVNTISPSSCSAGASSSSMSREQSLDDVNGDALLNNIPKNSSSVNTVAAAAAVVGVTAVAVGSTVRPLNLHFQASTAAAGLATESSYSVEADMHLIPAAALSRSFMMDYMWQHAHQAARNTYNQQYQHQPQHKLKSSNSAFTLPPWINATLSPVADIKNPENHNTNMSYSSASSSTGVNSSWPNPPTANITRNLSQIINTSAFKPVVVQHQHHAKKLKETPPSSTRSRRRHSTLQVSTYAHDAGQRAQNKSYNSFFSSDEDDNVYEQDNANVPCPSPSHDDKQHLATAENSETLDDDILVDIETTEDEKPNSFSTHSNQLLSTCSRISFTIDNIDTSHEELENNGKQAAASDDDVHIDVVHNDNDDTVLEFASLTPLAIIKHTTTENSLKTSSAPNTLSSPNVAFRRVSKDSDKLYNVDHSNSENVPPPPALSISPKSNCSSSCSRSSECLLIKEKHYEAAASPNSNPTNSSSSPADSYEDKKFKLNNTNQERSSKNNRKRSFENFKHDNDEANWRETNDGSITKNSDKIEEESQRDIVDCSSTTTKCKIKSIAPITREVQLIEALTHKYELNYYNNNNPNCKNNNNSNNNNNNNNSPIVNNNFNNNNNSNEFWQMARLCMQRPPNYEQNQQKQPQHNQQQLTRLPTLYYRQQQLHLSPAAEQNPQQNQQTLIPSTQQVYLHLQQHQQSVQKCQNSYSNEIFKAPISDSACHIPVVYIPESADGSSSSSTAYISMQQNNLDYTNKTNRANGIG